jgi:hypothetical protein
VPNNEQSDACKFKHSFTIHPSTNHDDKNKSLKLKLSEADAAALEHALNPDGVDRSGGGDAEVGWEEEAEAALGQLLRSKEAATAVAGTAATAAPPLATTAAKDATRLQRLLSLAIDRFGGGSGDGSGNGGGQ